MKINKKIAHEICREIAIKTKKMAEDSFNPSENSALGVAVVALNYLKYKEYKVNKVNEMIEYRLSFKALGLDDLADNPSFDFRDYNYLDELEGVTATTNEGEKLLSLLNWLCRLESASPDIIDSEIEEIKEELEYALLLTFDTSGIAHALTTNLVLDRLSVYPVFQEELLA